MKILHIIDDKYFECHKKTVSEFIMALSDAGVRQKIYTSENANLGMVSEVSEVLQWKVSKRGKTKFFASRLKLWFLLSSFSPDIVIKWGKQARKMVKTTSCVQVSFLSEKVNLANVDNSDYIITNSEDVFFYVKKNGYSGARSFLLTPFVYQYKCQNAILKDDYFIPERARVGFVGATFLKNIGFEQAFEALGVVEDTYFFVCGNGPDEEYVYEQALRVNLKARSRFVSDIDKTSALLKFADFAFLPFEDAQLAKYILEAMIQKKLVITVLNSNSSELIRDGITGFFIPHSDMYLIKKKLKDVLQISEEDKQIILDRAFETAQSYLADKVVLGYIQIFDELIKRYRGRKNLLN